MAACAPPPVDPARSGPFPENYRALVAAYVKRSFFDPYSIRDAAISDPHHGRMLDEQGWIVCLEANAKNLSGAYTGLRHTAYLIQNGAIIDEDSSAEVCLKFEYHPWPELNRKS